MVRAETVQGTNNSNQGTLGTLLPASVRAELLGPVRERIWVWVIYSALVTLLGWRVWGLYVATWWVGGLLGWFLLDIDHLVEVFWLKPDKPENKEILTALRQRQWDVVWSKLVQTAKGRTQLLLHSVVFQTLVVVLGIYVATSEGDLFGRAVVFCLWARMVTEQVREFLASGRMDSWWWQIQAAVSRNNQAVFLTVNISLLALLTLAIV